MLEYLTFLILIGQVSAVWAAVSLPCTRDASIKCLSETREFYCSIAARVYVGLDNYWKHPFPLSNWWDVDCPTDCTGNWSLCSWSVEFWMFFFDGLYKSRVASVDMSAHCVEEIRAISTVLWGNCAVKHGEEFICWGVCEKYPKKSGIIGWYASGIVICVD